MAAAGKDTPSCASYVHPRLEEVSSFWDPHLTWMTFVTAAVAAFSVNYWGSGIQGTFADSGLVIFAEGSGATTYELWEIVPFTLIGVLCGVVGALFNAMNKQLTLKRKSLLGAPGRVETTGRVAAHSPSCAALPVVLAGSRMQKPHVWW